MKSVPIILNLHWQIVSKVLALKTGEGGRTTFTPYTSLPKDSLSYLRGEDILVEYNSSSTIKRKFCGNCGSSIEWSGSTMYPDWASIALATLDTPYEPETIIEMHSESRACWLDI